MEPGDWGRIVNGGAWLEVEGERVDLLYRDLDVVEHWVAEAEAALRRAAPPVWDRDAAFLLLVAEGHAARGDGVAVAGLLARAAIAGAQARLAADAIWVLNEKGIIPRAGLEEADDILAAVGRTPERLVVSVGRMRDLLRLERPEDMQFDAVVRTGDVSEKAPRT